MSKMASVLTICEEIKRYSQLNPTTFIVSNFCNTVSS